MRLIAYERWMADAVARRQSEVRSPRVLWFERNYGPRGVALLAAAMASVVVSELIALAGVLVVVAVGVAGVIVLVVAGVVLLLGALRLVEAVRAGRTFRADDQPPAN